MSATVLCSLNTQPPDPFNVMPVWTTGGTDVICEKKQARVWRETRARGGGGQRKGERGRGREREAERERERKRDAMRQGYRDERKASLSLHFFNIPSS